MMKIATEKTEQQDPKGRKLVLNKETLRSLSDGELLGVAGGKNGTGLSCGLESCSTCVAPVIGRR